MLNRVLKNMGSGVYHCGVEVFGKEWSFADTESGQGNGVFECPPRKCKGHTYDETVLMGYTTLTEEMVHAIIEVLKIDWQASDYHLLEQNCCHFADDMCRRLGVRGVPERILHMSKVGEACIAGEPCSTCTVRCCEGAETIFLHNKTYAPHDDETSEEPFQPLCQLPVVETMAAMERAPEIMYAEGYEDSPAFKMRAHSVSLPPVNGSSTRVSTIRDRSWSLT